MRILLMMTKNWTDEWDRERFQNLSDWINLYIGNTGNLMWMNGARFICQLPENSFDFYDWFAMNEREKEYKEQICREYDAVVFPTANALQEDMRFLCAINDLIRGITIPIFFLGIGLTLTKGGTVNSLYEIIKEPFLELIHIVEKSGGAFGVRGYLTKELFDLAGAGELATVIGCPSMYQNGILKITEEKVREEEFRVALNGKAGDFKRPVFRSAFKDDKTVYICQDQFGKTLCSEYPGLSALMKQFGYWATRALAGDQIRYFYRLDKWYRYVKNSVDFSFGLRIHGNLISLLAEKPACVYLPERADLRVSELAEYFAVPTYTDSRNTKNLYEVYRETDYSAFNKKFMENFERYETFLKNHGLVKVLPREKTWLEANNDGAFEKENKGREEGYIFDFEQVHNDFESMGMVKHILYRNKFH